MSELVVIHPNREKAESKATKAVVVMLLIVSGGLTAVITIGGWTELQGAKPVAIVYILLYFVFAFYVSRWNRGLLPVASALAVLFAVVAAVSAPAWFDRDKAGFDNPALDPSILGLLTTILVPVQLLLVIFAMRGFSQKWNVEVEVQRDEVPSGQAPPPPPQAPPEPAGA